MKDQLFAKFNDLIVYFLSKQNKILFIIIVIFPLFLVSFYYLFIASDKFISESKLTVKQTGENPASFSVGLFTFGSPVSREDAYLLQEYIYSMDMLENLDKKLNLRQIFTKSQIDFFSRLDREATKEEFYEYYKDHVEVLYDDISSILTLKVFAYTPEDAQKINEAILEQCERYLNGISHKIAREQMSFIENELQIANQKFQMAKQNLIKFQNIYKVVDPSQEAQALGSMVAQLEAQLANKEAELKTLLSYLNENSFQVQVVRNQISALKSQIEKEKARLAGEGNTKLNKLMMEYYTLKLQTDFHTDIYKATLSAYETTRVEASRKLKNLVIIQSPNLPEEALYPKKGYNILLTVLLSLLIYGVIVLILGIIKEHRI